jgi:nucleoside-diphosphate-sugar epimerase
MITGVSGYLGSHVALTFLKDGTYNVRGTVRDTKNPVKIEPLKKAFGDYFDQLTLLEADLNDRQSIFTAVKGANYVVHTASPAPLKVPKDENELIVPAVNGTQAVMEACHFYKVKRVVITSSIAAVVECKPNDRPADGCFSEKNWSDPEGDHIDAYSKSKVLAERAAWNYVDKLPEDEKLEVVTIQPGLIQGPAFVGAGFFSGDLITNIMENKYPGLPKMKLALVGISEVAIAHLNAVKRPDAGNKRFVLVNETVWFKDYV